MTDSTPFSQEEAVAASRRVIDADSNLDVPDFVKENQNNKEPRTVTVETTVVRAEQSRVSKALDYAREHKGETIAYTAIGVVGAIALVSLMSGYGSGGRGPESSDTYGVTTAEIDASIASVTLTEGANVRFDPYVSGKTDAPNLVTTLDSPITINSEHDFKVIEGTTNGQWIGIPVEDFKKANPQFSDNGDKDGIVWVNQQGVGSIQRADLETK